VTVDDAEVIALGVMYVVFVPALWAIFAWDERRMTAEQKARAWPRATVGTVIAAPLFFDVLWLIGLPLHFLRTRRSLRGIGLAFAWLFVAYALRVAVILLVGLALGVDFTAE
jgi:hypothetical protein